MDTNWLNIEFPIKKSDGTSFHGLKLMKPVVDSVIMSLDKKVTGDVYYNGVFSDLTMQEYVEVEGVRYILLSPPTRVQEGLVKDNGDTKGLVKYSFVFHHPMCLLSNMPFSDVAVTSDETKYLSQNKTFSWIGTGFDMIDKLNKNLEETEWVVVATSDEPSLEKMSVLSDVMAFDKDTIATTLKKCYETWEVQFVVDELSAGQYYDADDVDYYSLGKKFVIIFGSPSNEILDGQGNPFVFQFGQGVGLKNNSRTPKNNKIVTRIAGYGSENNIPYGYPQIRWYGDQSWEWTEFVDDDPSKQPKPTAYPIYTGILGGQYVKLIKHPFTRSHLMPSIYRTTLFNKVSPYLPNGTENPDYDPDTELVDYYDADDGTYENPIIPSAPSYEIHEFEKIKPRLDENSALVAVLPYDEPKEGDYLTFTEFTNRIDIYKSLAVAPEEEHALTQMYNSVNGGAKESDAGASPMNPMQHNWYVYVWNYTTDEDYYYISYTSSHFNFEFVVLKRGHYTPPTIWDDTMDDDGNYVQSYFKVTLPQLSFDLYACASITEKMDINMRSGACIGCTFPINVDWDDYKKNFYNANGEFDPVPHTSPDDGHVRDAEKYPLTNQGQVTVIVQKENTTFGTLMPNVYQQPKAGDMFVILGISLPSTYIDSAETELDEAMVEYMRENNVHYFDYPLKFDEHFLTTHLSILSQIKENTIVRFAPSMALYVKQITVKYYEDVLPKYDITLTDDVEIVLNQVGQVTDDVSRMRVQLNDIQKYYGENIEAEIANRLSRVADDVALGRITFQQGLTSIAKALFADDIQTTDFSSGESGIGKGWKIDKFGNAELESLRLRSFLQVSELLINRLKAQEGDTLFADNDQIIAVEEQIDPTDQSVSYVLTLKEKWDGYITSQQYGNILKGIINTLAAKDAGISDEESTSVETDGENKYYISWMRVTATHATTPSVLGVNQIRVVLYGDEAVPAQKNFEPCELMNIARCGCVLNPYEEGITEAEKESRKRRQQVFYISTTDGRIAKLTGVNSPILQQGNYGTTLGTVPDFIKNWSIASRLIDGRDYLYAQGVIVGDFIKVNINGLPIVTYVDCGEWYDGGAQGATPTVGHGVYLVNEKNDVSLQWETHDVWYNGKKWRCLQHQPVVSGGETHYYPPKWNSQYWQMVEGSDGYEIKFTSSNGDRFRKNGNFSTGVTPFISCGTEDISLDIALDYWKWERCLASNWNDGHPIFTPEDETWNLAHLNTRVLTLTDRDMPSGWSFSNAAIFICTVAVNDGKTTQYIDNHVIV